MADVRYKLCAKGDSTRPYRPPLPMLFFSGANCYSAIFMVSHHCAPIKGSLLSARKCNIAKKRKCPPLVSCVSSKQENEQTLLKIFFFVRSEPGHFFGAERRPGTCILLQRSQIIYIYFFVYTGTE